ncbi:hypothetical protein [Aquitalea pelogenes]|uniref:hypothetical protein n=1 Tax=Aquitalea pelogenes TaxID=1293573 RepID=UPI001EFA304D|nr:hypothetical protein [Aquitalea pelogenes]
MNKPNWQQTAGVLMLTAMLGGCASFGEENNPATPLTASQLQLDPARAGSQVQAGWWQQLATRSWTSSSRRLCNNLPA